MFELLSKAFKNEKKIPDLYTCIGKGISPQLMWKNVPKDTKSFALIMDDLDSPIGVFTHWVFYNIPPEKRELQKDIPQQKTHQLDIVARGEGGEDDTNGHSHSPDGCND